MSKSHLKTIILITLIFLANACALSLIPVSPTPGKLVTAAPTAPVMWEWLAILHPRLNKTMCLCDMLLFHSEHDLHHLPRIVELQQLWQAG